MRLGPLELRLGHDEIPFGLSVMDAPDLTGVDLQGADHTIW
jgi:hypothetical protein